MTKAPQADRAQSPLPLSPDLPRPFHRAAISSRFIGVAALTLGCLSLFAIHKLPNATPPAAIVAYVLFGMLFGVPGLLYLILAGWVSRRRR